MKDTPFPSVTICTEGINLEATLETVAKDFHNWLRLEKNTTTKDFYSEAEHENNVKQFLSDTFGISPSYNISIDDIALAYSSNDPDK